MKLPPWGSIPSFRDLSQISQEYPGELTFWGLKAAGLKKLECVPHTSFLQLILGQTPPLEASPQGGIITTSCRRPRQFQEATRRAPLLEQPTRGNFRGQLLTNDPQRISLRLQPLTINNRAIRSSSDHTILYG